MSFSGFSQKLGYTFGLPTAYLFLIFVALSLHFLLPGLRSCGSGGFLPICFSIGFVVGYFASIPGYALLGLIDGYFIPNIFNVLGTLSFSTQIFVIVLLNLFFFFLVGVIIDLIVKHMHKKNSSGSVSVSS